jgi:EAL domain-containing protein (putative c-di-GMP-specific phosphodiesterase class I)/GGDEF domain-containing protein
MFRKLQTKVTILYTTLFVATFVLLAQAVSPVVSANAVRTTKAELIASRSVFDRIFAMKSRELQGNAELLARDFGFKSAVATLDRSTIDSALDNLRSRRGIDYAFLVTQDGKVTGPGAERLSPSARASLLSALNDEDRASGILQIGDAPCDTISAPVLAPQPMGWLVVASRLDRPQMSELEHLSAIPLQARLLHRDAGGVWRDLDRPQTADAPALDAFVRNRINGGIGVPEQFTAPSGRSLALVSNVKSLESSGETLLLLRYPMERALAPYTPLLLALTGLGALSLLVLVAGSWMLARSITRPVALLDSAVSRLGEGVRAEVHIPSNDEIGRLAGNFNTMSAAILEREQRITEMALHDAESGLPNRTALEAEIGRVRALHDGRSVVVAAIALDRLDVLRNAIGYPMVSKLLEALAIKATQLAPGALCTRVSTGRLGLCAAVENAEAALHLAERLAGGLNGPLALGVGRLDVSVTLGLVTIQSGDGAYSGDHLVEQANIAADQAQAAHKLLAVFDEAAYGDPAQNLSLMSELSDARSNGELSLYYQPKYDLRTGRLSGFEALCRWRHATRGLISPDLFVVMAEETGNIERLTEWVLDRALQDQATFRAAGFDLPIAINLSGRMVGDMNFAQRAVAAIRAAQGLIAVEITETAVISNPEISLSVIELFETHGVPISIDDYGSGLSSLAYLKRIRAHELKIDKAFVLLIDQNPRDRLLVKSTIDLAHGLGMKVVAEGVETAEALALLAGMGCDYAQGYHIARPMPVSEALTFLANFEVAPDAQARSA